MTLSFHRLVQAEVNDAVEWYEAQKKGLGDDFFGHLTRALEKISECPESYGFWLGSQKIRHSRIERFPYTVLYEIHPEKVRILCVRHNKRRPDHGLRRA